MAIPFQGDFMKLFSASHAARELNISVATIRLWTKQNKLEFDLMSNGTRIFREDTILAMKEKLEQERQQKAVAVK